MVRRVLALLALLLSVSWIFAAASPQSAKPSPGAEAEIRAAEAAMMQNAKANGSAGYMSFYSDDAVELPNNLDAIVGKTAITASVAFLDDHTGNLAWKPERVEVSKSGDLGYTYGTYQFLMGGSPVSHGKYTTIWRKQSDGKWKIVLRMANPSGGQ